MKMGRWIGVAALVLGLAALAKGEAAADEPKADLPAPHGLADGEVIKSLVEVRQTGESLLRPEAWEPWQKGFQKEGDAFACDNGSDARAQRGASQHVQLNQTSPQPIVASAWSKAEGVGGSRDSDYSLYLDLVYADGTPLWGQTASFSVGTHDWERREVVLLPEKPVKSVSVHLLLRRHAGKAWFRAPEFRELKTPAGACLFDGVAVVPKLPVLAGFQVRDVAANTGFVRIDRQALGLELRSRGNVGRRATFIDADITDTTGKDRAITLVYARPFGELNWRWLANPRRSEPMVAPREYMDASRFHAGANGRLSRYPLAAAADPEYGLGLAIDLAYPAFFRIGANAGTRELFLAYDLALTPEKPTAHIRLCQFGFDPDWDFRIALARYYELFPESFRCKTPEQGLWMPFGKISQVKGWEDFGFKFKEGNDETQWDDDHGIRTFRYTEPMTWWMRMPKDMPRTLEAALAEAKRLAEKGDPNAKALLASGYHDETGRIPARLLDTPWCNGAVWSMNSMPGIQGEFTDFKNKWNPTLRERFYGPKRNGDLDGEYVDSSEGYVTDELDFRRDHFAAADTPLTFSPDSLEPAIFRGLIAFEYTRAIARDVHALGKLMMANGAPTQLPWLCPMLQVMGTETDWNWGGTWHPMSDADLLYRREMCKGKPYCFLMNTDFDKFPPPLVEKYMKRCLAYGMFPGFFSADASTGQYFQRPDLYERDRPLFKKYVPLCKKVAEAGWEPITRARSSDERVYVERFGDRLFTLFNDSPERRTATITLDSEAPGPGCELFSGKLMEWRDRKATLTLEAEDVAVIEFQF